MNILKLIDSRHVLVDMPLRNKEEVINKLISRLYEDEKIGSKTSVMNQIQFNEIETISGIGHGIAIPQVHSRCVYSASISIVVLKQDIIWESIDNRNVRTIILIIAPEEDESPYFDEIIRMLGTGDKLEMLTEVVSVADVMTIFQCD